MHSTTYLPPTASFYLLASMTVSFLAGSSAPTPLYPLYQAMWGFSPVMLTIVFAIYALAVLAALLIAGRLSDHLGRRPVLIVAAIGQVLVMLLFATAESVTGLLVARVVQGVTTGAAIGAIGAAMIDLDKSRGTVANAVAPPFGTALGALMGGIFLQYLPGPTHFVYAVLAAIFMAQVLGLTFMKESISAEPGVLGSLKPRLNLPRATREPLLFAVPILIAVWALAGFYGSLGPMLIRGMLNSRSPVLGGLALFVLAASAGISVLLLQQRTPRQMMMLGAGSLFAGVGLTALALPQGAIGLFFLGTAVAGIGFGVGFQGAVRSVIPSAAPHERAGTLSIIFIICYLAMGVPAVAAGSMLARHVNIIVVAQYFCAVIMALSLLGATRRNYGVEATPSVELTAKSRSSPGATRRNYGVEATPSVELTAKSRLTSSCRV
ncbi:MAG TPA: MFS transporter [Steroidobacteraceae bacterium]|jgi:predicted MFS family arabinose efflux permease